MSNNPDTTYMGWHKIDGTTEKYVKAWRSSGTEAPEEVSSAETKLPGVSGRAKRAALVGIRAITKVVFSNADEARAMSDIYEDEGTSPPPILVGNELKDSSVFDAQTPAQTPTTNTPAPSFDHMPEPPQSGLSTPSFDRDVTFEYPDARPVGLNVQHPKGFLG